MYLPNHRVVAQLLLELDESIGLLHSLEWHLDPASGGMKIQGQTFRKHEKKIQVQDAGIRKADLAVAALLA